MKFWVLSATFSAVILAVAACGGQELARPAPTAEPTATSAAIVTATGVPRVAAETATVPAPVPTATPIPVATPLPQAPTPVPTPIPVPTATLTPTPVPLPNTSLKNSRPSVLDYVDRPPPIASLITIGTPGPDGMTEVTGAPGAVPGSVDVMVATVEYSDAAFVVSAPDGSFSASVISAPGATVQVRHNPHFPDAS